MRRSLLKSLAALAAATACSENAEVQERPGREHPRDHGHGGTIGEGGSEAPGGSGGGGGGGTDGEGGGGGSVGPGPWPVDDVRHFDSNHGIPGRVTGVGVDDGQNVYVIDGSAVYAAKAGVDRFVRTASGGQFDTGHFAASVCGGEEGRVYVGYLSYEKEPELLTEEEKLLGDMDRFRLKDDGTLALEFHHRLQNSNARWMDHTRSIFTCARVVGGPNHGDLYVGSNHGVTLIRGDEYADHRHPIFDLNGSQAIGFVWDVNTDPAGSMLMASHWMVAALPPAPMDTVLSFIDYGRSVWAVNTYAENLGPIEDPDDLHAIAGDLEGGRVYVGSWGKGLSAMQMAPRVWWSVAGTPDSFINALELDPTDGKLWVGTAGSGLWRWDPATEEWEQSPYVPAGAVNDVYLDTSVEPRAVYVGTNSGLYVIRAP